MAEDSGSKNPARRRPQIKGWFVLLAALTLGAGYLYHLYQQRQEIFVNTYYFRTLQEVAREFNDKLEQLASLHRYKESESTILSIFSSYRAEDTKTGEPCPSRAADSACKDASTERLVEHSVSADNPSSPGQEGKYLLGANSVKITLPGKSDEKTREYRVDIEDLLPAPSNDFVLYVIADGHNRVLSSVGGASGLSLIDTEAISRALQIQQNQDWLNLASRKEGPEPEAGKALPGFSTYIDLQLTTGKSRAFILPFYLRKGVAIPPFENAPAAGADNEGLALYLVGIQPEGTIKAYENKRWNLSLLLLSLVLLLFVWTVARLLMLSRHQPLGNSFYRMTIILSYLSFLTLVAILIAWSQREGARDLKHESASRLLSGVQESVESDLYHIFHAVNDYRDYFRDILRFSDGASGPEPVAHCGIGGLQACDHCTGPPALQIGTLLLHPEVPPKDGARIRQRPDDAPLQWETDVCSAIDHREVSVDEKGPLPAYSLINVYAPGTRVQLREENGPQVREWFDIDTVSTLPAGGRFLGVFLMNADGQQVLPTFYYTENNKLPDSYSLAHRDYFRRVRDQRGWDATLRAPALWQSGQPGADGGHARPCAETAACRGDDVYAITARNFYIQRLLNLNTGTRGTTLGLPLVPEDSTEARDAEARQYILGADIELPSLALTEWREPEQLQDLTMMVVDRLSGQVLYHTDNSRSLVENLYHAGQGSSLVSQTIRAGRFSSPPNERFLRGFYHGRPGDFLIRTLPISQWALVAFIPDATSDSAMTNTFLASALAMSALLMLMGALTYLTYRFIPRLWLDIQRDLPAAVNRHSVLFLASIFLASAFFAHGLGTIIAGYTGSSHPLPLSSLIATCALAITLTWASWYLFRLRRAQESAPAARRRLARGEVYLLLVFGALGLGVIAYLNHMGNRPVAALDWYYRSLHQARLNQEYNELTEIALTRYPNSIKEHQVPPLSMLPISDAWREQLEGAQSGNCVKQRHVVPAEVGTFSQFTASTGPYDWAMRYLINLPPDGSRPRCNTGGKPGDAGPRHAGTSPPAQAGRDTSRLLRFTLVVSAVFTLLCIGWYYFFKWVLLWRLVGTPGLIEHLRQILARNEPERAFAPKPGLVLDLHCELHAGHDLDALLLRFAGGPDGEGAAGERDERARGIALLLRECPWLAPAGGQVVDLPGLNIDFDLGTGAGEGDGTGARIHLSELDTCLSRTDSRANLLRLVRQLKVSLAAGELAEFRISLGFHSYEALLLKAHSLETERQPMAPAEFAAWAETLMDFSVVLPGELTRQVDPDFVAYECSGSKLLQRLPEYATGKKARASLPWRQRWRWLYLNDVDKSTSEWASINYILLQAGALFRHKWETCSSAEKIALYFLARHKRINTANAQLLEQLALQGLIRVERGRIRILNNSFAYFARHAEDTEALKELVQMGEVSVWKEYRLPVTLVILLLLGGIAFTSGSSLYMIAASLLGLLGTIGSLTSSAHMIRENLR